MEPSVPQVHTLLESASALPVTLSPVETTEHFGEPLVGELRMTDAAWNPYLDGAELPGGTQIALLVRRAGAPTTEEPVRVLWMEKLEHGWRFDADSGDGRPVDGERFCARCHREAPSDSVFRIRPPHGNSGEPPSVGEARPPVGQAG